MPPSPPHDVSAPTILPTATAQQNTRALLLSLEELRDSLSSRVEQLGVAVERLRGQAGDLERALEGDLGSPAGVGRTDETNARQVHSRMHRSILTTPVTSNPQNALPSSNAITARPSAIGHELSSLSRPVTTDEINSLLDRASQTTSISPDPWTVRAQTIENRIQRLSETARDLRMRATQSWNAPIDDHVPPPPVPPSVRDALTTPSVQPIEDTVPGREGGSGLSRLLTRVREDQDRLEAGIRRLNNAGVGIPRRHSATHQNPSRTGGVMNTTATSTDQSSNAVLRSTQNVAAPAMSRRELSKISARTARGGSRGLPPTNIQLLARQPAPAVIRSKDVSPATVYQPSIVAGLPPPVESTPDPAPVPPRGRARPVLHPPAPSRNRSTVAPRPSHSLPSAQPLGRSYASDDFLRDILQGREPGPIASLDLSLPPANLINTATRDDSSQSDGLTYRGMSVASRMGEPSDSEQGQSRRPHRDPIGEDHDTFLSLWPSLRQLFEQGPRPGPPEGQSFEASMETTIRALQAGTNDSDPVRSQTRQREARRRQRAERQRQRDSEQDFRSLLDFNAEEVIATRTRTTDYLSALGGANPTIPNAELETDSDGDGNESGEEGNGETSVLVIDLTVDPPQYTSRRLPHRGEPNANNHGDARYLNETTSGGNRPWLRPTEEVERIRAERDAANERIERSRQSLRRIQQLRRDMNLVRDPLASTNSPSPLQMEIGVEEPGLTSTQGISAADAMDRSGEVNLMRALVIDDVAEEADTNTVYVGEGERTEVTQGVTGSNASITNTARRQSTDRPTREQIQPPKESFDCDFHLWPTNGPVARVGDSRVYGSLSRR